MDTAKAKLLIIDDEPEYLEAMSKPFQSEFQVFTAPNGQEGIRVARVELPDLIILDIKMPGMNGYDVCTQLRTNELTRKIPIIILSALSNSDSQIKIFNCGADDFIEKPFELKNLIARVHSKVRRSLENKGTPATLINCGNIKINEHTMEVFLNNKPIELSRLEFKFLIFFVSNKDVILDRNRILNTVWPDSHVTERTIDTHIYNLKIKLNGFDHKFKLFNEE
jgi:two-component system alkaline phosphatase synthesis response regulator PhoP